MVPNMRLADESVKRSLPKKIHFTIQALKAATCPAGKGRIYIYDSKAPGLALMVTEAGKKSFYVVLRGRLGQRRNRIRLGTFPDISVENARDLAAELAGNNAMRADVFAKKDAIKKDATLGEIWTRWLAEYAEPRLRAGAIVRDTSRFNTCFSDWKGRLARSITPADVQAKINALASTRGRTTANRAAQLLRRLLAFAKVPNNPCAKGEIDLFTEAPRERYLTAEELAALLTAIDAEPSTTIADACRMAIYTGQRRGNVLSMGWAEIDLDHAVWTIPATKFKTGKTLVVPLVGPAMEVLNLRKGGDSPHVFPGRKGNHLQEVKFAWKRIVDRAGLADLHWHDLRHNVASWAVQHGASLYAVGKVLGHADAASTARYAHLGADPLRATLELATDAMTAAVAAVRAKPGPA